MRRVAAVALIVTLLAAAPPASAATLQADYRFTHTLDSSCCGAPALTSIGLGANGFSDDTVAGVQRTVLTFPVANGLELPVGAVIPVDSYTIAVRFRFDVLDGFRRIIAVKDATLNGGLYNFNGQLNFYPAATGSGNPPPFAPGAYAQAIVTRDAATEEVVGYVNGHKEISFIDGNDDATVGPAGVLRFFKDDDSVGGEESAGAVARIRLWDGPLTTAQVAALDVADLPVPELGEEVNVGPVSGTVLVATRARGGAHAGREGPSFVRLSQARQIPTGSFLDTSRGTVQLVSATGSGSKTQSGKFSGGIFQVLQSRKPRARSLTELRLTGARFNRCRGRGASTAGLSRRTLRRLKGNAKGRFRTRGRNSAATVRGTVWITADRCDGTLTTVKRGRVAVRDFSRKKTIVIRAAPPGLPPPPDTGGGGGPAPPRRPASSYLASGG
jgi:Concanavalin A-like lectin/glucanases superfamily